MTVRRFDEIKRDDVQVNVVTTEPEPIVDIDLQEANDARLLQ